MMFSTNAVFSVSKCVFFALYSLVRFFFAYKVTKRLYQRVKNGQRPFFSGNCHKDFDRLMAIQIICFLSLGFLFLSLDPVLHHKSWWPENPMVGLFVVVLLPCSIVSLLMVVILCITLYLVPLFRQPSPFVTEKIPRFLKNAMELFHTQR